MGKTYSAAEPPVKPQDSLQVTPTSTLKNARPASSASDDESTPPKRPYQPTDPVNSKVSERDIEPELAVLRDLGFLDDETNTQKLMEFGYNLDRTINALFAEKEEENECSICCNQTTEWGDLECSHKLCTTCHGKLQKRGRTMSGNPHTFIKCPFCNGVSGGPELGTCPDGTMTTIVHNDKQLLGYEGYGTITVQYELKSGTRLLRRNGYLPNSPEGKHALALLRIAWERRHIFRSQPVEDSTTGEEDVFWNIEHKTRMEDPFSGYPDATYLERLLYDLKTYGIE